SSNSNGELFGDGGAAGTMVHTSVHYANQPCPRGSSAHRKVLIVSGSGNDPNNASPINTNPDYEATVWDPQSGKITAQRIGWDMFCNGMSIMQDGRVLINGGTSSYGAPAVVGGNADTPFTGLANSSIFDPATETFSVAD